MRDINDVTLTGRLTRDPEIKVLTSGKSVAKFSIAVSSGKDKEGKDRPANFFDCDAWEKTAEIIGKYLKKGSQVAINGRLNQQRWETAEGGKRSKVVVSVNTILFTGAKKTEAGPAPADEAPPPPPVDGGGTDDEGIPF